MKRLIYMGTPDFAVEPLKELIRTGADIAAVFTQPDKPRGRSGRMQPTPVKETAEEAGIPVYTPVKLRDPEMVELIREIDPEIIVIAAYGQIIPDSILEIPKYGCINIHASLLPKYRGAAPIQRAVMDGEKQSGVTIMEVTHELDSGDILMQKAVELAPDETGGSLFDKLMHLGAALLPEALKKLEAGEIKKKPQPKESPTPYAAMFKKEDGLVDWSMDAVSLERMFRALDPWPGAYTFIDGRQLKLHRATVCEAAEDEGQLHAGLVCSVEKDGFTVQTGKGRLKILEVQLEGKKRMDSAAFLRGFPLKPGAMLRRTREQGK